MFKKCAANHFILNRSAALNVKPFILAKRWNPGSNHWATLRKKKEPSDKALDHFDDFYASVFKKSWSSIRLALLSPQKYCAVVNNFADVEDTISTFESNGALNMKKVIDIERDRILAKNSNRRKERASKVHASDLKIDQLAEQKKLEEFRKIHPESESPIELQENLTEENSNDKENRLDWSRQINADGGFESSALYDYMPATKLKGRENWIEESEHYQYYDHLSNVAVEIVPEDELRFPEHLKVYCYESGNVTQFSPAKKGRTNVLNYYLMNASSLLPVLALGLNSGDAVLDMCAAPGGKSLLALQTLYPEYMVCNDKFREDRIRNVLDSYFFNQSHIKVTAQDGMQISDENTYNKILVDVPCTNDRHSLNENDNNIFKQSRIKERFRLPEIQSKLLSNALKLVKVGGTVVYSTCSLSPIQNDGVVQMALSEIWQDTNHKIVVKDMTVALEPASIFFKFDNSYRLKYGHLIVPYLPANFGPLYFCKLIRIE